MAVEGVEPPFVTTDHRQVVVQSRPWGCDQHRAAMRRLPAAQPLMAVNDRFHV
jgi:hypothetical protein